MGDSLKQAFGRVVDKLAPLSLDELLAFEWLIDRVNAGALTYGRFDASTDDRDLRMERAAERGDDAVYASFDYVKRELARKRRIECFAHDAIVPALDELIGDERDVARAGIEEVE